MSKEEKIERKEERRCLSLRRDVAGSPADDAGNLFYGVLSSLGLHYCFAVLFSFLYSFFFLSLSSIEFFESLFIFITAA